MNLHSARGNMRSYRTVKGVMSRSSRLFVAVLTAALAALALPGCGDQQSAGAGPSSDIKVSCRAFTRPSVETSIQERKTIRSGPVGDDQSVSIGDFRFRNLFSSDEFEGTSLVVYVYPQGQKKAITHSLYQFDSSKPPSNQFPGGHGFTGLIYVNHPDLGAELQFFCKAL